MTEFIKRRRTDFLVIHGTATPPGWRGGGAEAAAEIVRIHVEEKGWIAGGYNDLIDESGAVHSLRPVWAVGAGVEGFNSASYHVAMLGGESESGEAEMTYTPAQMGALERLLERRAAEFPGAVVLGHRDLSPDADGDGELEPHEYVKACPSFAAIPWAASRGLPAARLGQAWGKGDPRRPAAPDARIAWLQRLLAQIGHQIHADGIEGPRTAEAIREFQRAESLPLSGRFDAVTVARLRERAEPRATPDRPAPQMPATPSGWMKLTGAVVAASTWWAGLDWYAQLAVFAATVGCVLMAYRQMRRTLERQARLAGGDPAADPAPDFFDWAGAHLSAVWAQLVGSLSGETPKKDGA